ncbi:Uncharacterized protein APZ42_023845 [Daphnia magna]|uniref:Uncharacterized protein n=1 Tax=Daphnia magna TaxID=35525 RepID=A0A164U7E1_9CRUS|nr:Uncharacterized protein APZ42_023845 [Daphnia magna]
MRSAMSLIRRCTNRICFNTDSNRYKDKIWALMKLFELIPGNLPGCLLSFCRQAIPLVDSLVNIDQQRSFKANTDINVRLISKNCI